MPVYEFTQNRNGAKRVIISSLSFSEFEIYKRLAMLLGGRPELGEAGEGELEATLYKIMRENILQEEMKKEIGDGKSCLSFEEFTNAYEKLERDGVLYRDDGRLAALPRTYSPIHVVFSGPGFYTTDNSRGNKEPDAAKREEKD